MKLLDRIGSFINPLIRIAVANERIADALDRAYPPPVSGPRPQAHAELIETTDAQHRKWENQEQRRREEGRSTE